MRNRRSAPLLFGLVVLFALAPAACRRKDDKGKDAPVPKGAPPPLVAYVNQKTSDGKFIAPLAPPAPRTARDKPALPDLPSIADQKKQAKPSAGTKHPCGSVDVHGSTVALDCMDNEYGKIEHASMPLVGYDVLHGSDVKLPQIVDHRADGTEGPIRDQGEAPSCTAFSLASAVDHAINRWTGASSKVSVMQIWARYHAPQMGRAEFGNIEKPLAPDSDWAYSDRVASSWLDVPTCRAMHENAASCGQSVDLTRLNALEQRPIAEITDVAQLADAHDTQAMRAKLALGQDVWIGLHVGGHLSCGKLHCGLSGPSGAKYIRDFDATKEGGHAILIAGYADLPHGTYFLLHNSWGEKWGDGGYAWLHEDTLKRNIEHAYVIDAHPLDAAKQARAKRRTVSASCAAGLLPDSISGDCVPPCPDASPRHNAVCAVAKQCPAGEVNLTGNCVLGAPTRAGVEPKTKITFKCGPGGCAYTIPQGVGGCSSGTCQVSCPSPDFRLGKGRNGFTCME